MKLNNLIYKRLAYFFNYLNIGILSISFLVCFLFVSCVDGHGLSKIIYGGTTDDLFNNTSVTNVNLPHLIEWIGLTLYIILTGIELFTRRQANVYDIRARQPLIPVYIEILLELCLIIFVFSVTAPFAIFAVGIELLHADIGYITILSALAVIFLLAYRSQAIRIKNNYKRLGYNIKFFNEIIPFAHNLSTKFMSCSTITNKEDENNREHSEDDLSQSK